MSKRNKPTAIRAELKRDAKQPGWITKKLGLDKPRRQLIVKLAPDAFGETGNPYYLWQAIGICIEDGLEFPNLVRDYLAIVAENMMSPWAKREHDLRKVLPYILGFDMKRGRHLLDPEPVTDDRGLLAMRFATQIQRGTEPKAALANVREAADCSLADKDDRTLLSYIKKHFDITDTPRTREQWEAGIDAWMCRVIQAIRE
jgi:hypothetical protein